MKASDLLTYTFPAETFQGGLQSTSEPIDPPSGSPGTLDATALSALPTFFSLATVVSPPEDQGRRGTCATFAMSAIAEFVLDRELSEQHLYLEAWKTFHGSNPSSTEEATSIDAVADALLTRGVCAEEEWAYSRDPIPGNASQGPLPGRVLAAPRYRIASYRIAPPEAPASAAICSMMHRDRKPVVATLPVLENAGWDCGFVVDVPRDGGEIIHGWHAVVLVGFNTRDRLAFMLNSWGPYWAMCGYAAITFDYLDRYTRTVAGMR